MPSMALCDDDSGYCFKALCRPAQTSHSLQHDTREAVCVKLPDALSFNDLRVWSKNFESGVERPVTLAGLK